MKNLFFTLAFMLIGSFSFANNCNESTVLDQTKEVETVVLDGSIEVTLSCGITGTLSWTGDATTADVIDAVMYFDDLLC